MKCLECDAPVKSKNLCRKHYYRQWSSRQPRATRDMTDDERFDYYTAPSPFGCLLWTGSVRNSKYGQFLAGGKSWSAHRYAYQRAHGPIPAGLFVCHRCDEPRCVNPEHLFLGTHDDNTVDMVKKARSAAGARHPLAKLTEDDVRFIRATNVPGIEVAKMLGVTPANVSAIRVGKTWRHVK